MNCPNCGTPLEENAQFCGSCGAAVTKENAPAAQMPAKEEKPENVLTGTIGALLGAILGGAVIILMSRLGYVAGLSGLAVAISTLTGYEILGHRKPAKGLIICLLIMAVTPYIADRIDWALVITKEYGDSITFWEAYSAVPDMIDNGINPEDYRKNLLMVYGFAILGAFGTLRDFFKKK